MDNYFSIFIYRDEVIVNWNIGGDSQNRRFQKEHFEGQWLTLHFEVKDTMFKGGFKEMINDDAPNFIANNFDSANFTQIFALGTIYLGGSDNKTFDYQSIISNEYNNASAYVMVETVTDFAFTSNAVEIPENGFTTDYPMPFYKSDLNKSNDRFKVSSLETFIQFLSHLFSGLFGRNSYWKVVATLLQYSNIIPK